jgi:hypothetical protein
MSNLSIVKKAQRIQMILILSYLFVLIGSINITTRIAPDEYVGVFAILTFVGSLIFQIGAYMLSMHTWLKKGFSLTTEPEELLRLLQNGKIINPKYTLKTIQEKYHIKWQKQNKAKQAIILPDEICIFPNKTFNLESTPKSILLIIFT